MSSNRRPIFNDQEIGGNPFVVPLKITVVERTIDGQFKKIDDHLVRATIQLEYDIYAKIYTNKFHRIALNKLPVRSKELLMWLIFSLKPGKDYVWINKRRYMKECRISSIDTYKKALYALIKDGFLCHSIMPDVFWINPQKFFKGSRVFRFPDNVVHYRPSTGEIVDTGDIDDDEENGRK